MTGTNEIFQLLSLCGLLVSYIVRQSGQRTKVKLDCACRACVNTGTAQNAVGMFHSPFLHHAGDRQAHWADLITGLAVAAVVRDNCQPKGRKMQNVGAFAPQNHKGCHPAECVTEAAATKKPDTGKNDANHQIVCGHERNIMDRNAPVGAQKWINRGEASANKSGDKSDGNYLDNPDHILDPFAITEPVGSSVDSLSRFTKTRHRTSPAAPGAPQNKGTQKQQAKGEVTA